MKNCKVFSVIIVVLSVLLICMACSSDDSSNIPDGDSELDAENDSIATDGDSLAEIEIESGCTIDGCRNDLYCDSLDGICKACSEDYHCGVVDPLSKITPICRSGKCEDAVCGSVITVPPPANGVELGLSPIRDASFSADGVLVVENRPHFPIGIMSLNPELFDEANEAGANLVISSRACCYSKLDIDYQIVFLQEADRADLFAGILAIWPFADYGDTEISMHLNTKNSIADRANKLSMLFWLLGDHAQNSGLEADVSTTYEIISSVVDSILFAVFEDKGFDASPYISYSDFFAVSLDSASQTPGAEITRVKSANPNTVIWARIVADDLDEQRLKAIAIAAIASGANGIIFELEDESSTSPANWNTVKNVSRYLKDNSPLFLTSRENQVVKLSKPVNGVSLLGINYENKVTIAYIVNTSNQVQEVKLSISTEQLPYCIGIEQENQLLHMRRDEEITITIKPNEVVVYQVTETSSPGE